MTVSKNDFLLAAFSQPYRHYGGNSFFFFFFRVVQFSLGISECSSQLRFVASETSLSEKIEFENFSTAMAIFNSIQGPFFFFKLQI